MDQIFVERQTQAGRQDMKLLGVRKATNGVCRSIEDEKSDKMASIPSGKCHTKHRCELYMTTDIFEPDSYECFLVARIKTPRFFLSINFNKNKNQHQTYSLTSFKF